MSDLFYNIVWQVGNSAFWSNSSPIVINAEVTRRPGAYILASNHFSPYDVPLLMRHSKRLIDFVSIVEVFRKPWVAWFFGSMNAFPLDRWKPDAPTVRIILDRLERGRVIAMFPEGQFRKPEDSVVNGGQIRRGIGRIAQLAKVPVIPAVVLNSRVYSQFLSWMPIKRTHYGVIFGQPLELNPQLEPEASAAELEDRLCTALRQLYSQLLPAVRAEELTDATKMSLKRP